MTGDDLTADTAEWRRISRRGSAAACEAEIDGENSEARHRA